MEIWIVLGILAGVLGGGGLVFFLTKKHFSSELASLKQKTDQDKKKLNNQLEKRRQEISNLNSQLEANEQEIGNLNNQLEANEQEISNLNSQLEANEQEIGNLNSQLEANEQEISNLNSQLEANEQEISNLNSQLEDNRQEISNLNNQLEDNRQEIDSLNSQWNLAVKNNKSALQLVHLFELSLQVTAVVLYSERVRNVRLVKSYRELEEKYEELHQEFKETVKSYDVFRKKVDRKARQRLTRAGVGAALSLIPGIGLFQVVNDLIELLNLAAETVDGLDNLDSAVETFTLSGDAISSLAAVWLLLPETPSDQDSPQAPTVLKRDYQSVVKETFESNLGPTLEAPDMPALNAFVKDVIERMKGIVESGPKSERKNAVAKIVNNFNQFGISSYPDGRPPKAPGAGSTPSSEN